MPYSLSMWTEHIYMRRSAQRALLTPMCDIYALLLTEAETAYILI